MSRRALLTSMSGLAASAFLTACGGASKPASQPTEIPSESEGPNFAVVFPQGKVNKISVTVSAENWQKMLDDSENILGQRGLGDATQDEPGLSSKLNSTSRLWVPATVQFVDKTYKNVGFRFKGNSSLRAAWRSGNDRFPFKLDFDQFESEFPETKNQRLYGFKQISLSTNYNDPSLLRESIVADLFRDAGLVVSQTASYELFLDRGQGATSLGIYTATEVIDDTLVKRSFSQSNGNLYEVEGRGATLDAEVLPYIEDTFRVEGGKNADWSDVKKLHSVLHSAERSSNPTAWRKSLEAIFDVQVFLEWLAISGAVQHWDTYGLKTHNYYLYNDPATGRLTWLTWDHNYTFGIGPMGKPVTNLPALDKKSVSPSWPLIRFLLDQPEYYAAYRNHLATFARDHFTVPGMEGRLNRRVSVLRNSVPASERQKWEDAVQEVRNISRERISAVNNFLAIPSR